MNSLPPYCEWRLAGFLLFELSDAGMLADTRRPELRVFFSFFCLLPIRSYLLEFSEL